MSKRPTLTIGQLKTRIDALSKRLATQIRTHTAHITDPAAHTRAIEAWADSIPRPDPDDPTASPLILSARLTEAENMLANILEAHTRLSHHDIEARLINLRDDINAPQSSPPGDAVSHDARLANIATRVNSLERSDPHPYAKPVADLARRVADLEDQNVPALAERIETLEQQELHEPITEIIADVDHVNSKVQTLYDRVNTLETVDVPSLRDNVASLRTDLDDHGSDDHTNSFGLLSRRIDALTDRIQSAENVQQLVAEQHASYPHHDTADFIDQHAGRLHAIEQNVEKLLADRPPFEPDDNTIDNDQLILIRQTMTKMATHQHHVAVQLTLILARLS